MTTRPTIKLSGINLLHDPASNKGTAFTEEERDNLGLRGLLPPRVNSQEMQIKRVLENLRKKTSDLEKYVFLESLQDRNETLYYRVVMENIEEMMPLIYTPTVGWACQEYGHLFRRPRGLFISANDFGNVSSILENWPEQDVRVIVVTDGERILGLGDLAANGMGIPVGKLALYTACGGIHPSRCLPVTLDVGTESSKLLNDPLYLGLRQRRIEEPAYDALIEEFVTAVQERFPHALIQFEDFANHNAFRLLKKYEDKICTFNDDIQGTSAVALAGLCAAARITHQPLKDQRFLFFGAGEAGTGIADLIVAQLVEDGLAIEQARARCWFVDSHGLVVRSRTDLADHKLPYAVDQTATHDILQIIDTFAPTALIGVAAHQGLFTDTILQRMAKLNERPIIFALSNPTSRAECTAEAAYTQTDGRAIFASGSPFAPVTYKGRTHVPGQANNAYIFPGVGLGVVASQSRRVIKEMFLAAALTLAGEVCEEDLKMGRIFPSLAKSRKVAAAIAVATAEVAYRHGVAGLQPRPSHLLAFVQSQMYEPVYEIYV